MTEVRGFCRNRGEEADLKAYGLGGRQIFMADRGAESRPDLVRKGTPYVYFARGKATGLIKIGTSKTPSKRVRNVSYAAGEVVEILFTVRGGRDRERRFHEMFRDTWSEGEWFVEDGKLQKFLNARGFLFGQKLQKAAPAGGQKHPIAPSIATLAIAGITRQTGSRWSLDSGLFHLWRHYKTFCGKDCQEWIHMDARIISEVVKHKNCCAKCAANLQ